MLVRADVGLDTDRLDGERDTGQRWVGCKNILNLFGHVGSDITTVGAKKSNAKTWSRKWMTTKERLWNTELACKRANCCLVQLLAGLAEWRGRTERKGRGRGGEEEKRRKKKKKGVRDDDEDEGKKKIRSTDKQNKRTTTYLTRPSAIICSINGTRLWCVLMTLACFEPPLSIVSG
jgi:hypothetical protein